jgi:hypothetical protein
VLGEGIAKFASCRLRNGEQARKLGRFLIRDAPAPTVAVELAAHRVSAAVVEFRGGRPVVAMHATEPLPDGALVPSLVGQNIPGRAAVAEALSRVLDQVGRPRRIGLVLSDPVAKVSLVRFDQLPARAQDLDQLIRWQVRKAAPPDRRGAGEPSPAHQRPRPEGAAGAEGPGTSSSPAGAP